jgi:hypothetical protein
VLAESQAGNETPPNLEQAAFGWTHHEVAGWLFDEWGLPETLRDAVTDDGRLEDGSAAYPMVGVISSLSTPGEPDEAAGATAERIATVLACPESLPLRSSAMPGAMLPPSATP